VKIAVIPARGGSKRIVGKNIREFCGQPVIKYSIDTAVKCGLFDHVVVSTDSEEIAAVATRCGASVPFIRPADLSGDMTPTVPVVAHAIGWVHQNLGATDFACCVYATAPFVESIDLSGAMEVLTEDPLCEFVFPVTTFPFPIFRGVTVQEGRVEMIWPEHELTRSQDLPEACHDAGQFYWGRTEAWMRAKGVYSSRCRAYRIPRWRVQDLDTPEDWVVAERMFAALGSQQ
jgi:N-acylneuraminate cytidylyltransferase